MYVPFDMFAGRGQSAPVSASMYGKKSCLVAL